MSRRTKGEGTCYRDGFKFKAEITREGKRIRRSGKTAVIARARLAEALGEMDAPPEPPAAQSVGQFIDTYLGSLPDSGLEFRYQQNVKRHLGRVRKVLGDVPLRALTVAQVQDMLAHYDRGELKGKRQTLRDLRKAFAALLGLAQRDGLVTMNAAALTRPPKLFKPPHRPMISKEQRRKIVAAADAADPGLSFIVSLALNNPLREGEIFGLQWGDLDLESGDLNVRRSLGVGEGWKPVLKPTKNAQSHRLTVLNADALRRAREYRRQLKTEPLPSAMLFTSPKGRLIRASNWYRREFKPLLKAAGMTDAQGKALFGMHATRRTSITLALDNDVPVRAVASMAGHSSTRTTLDVYAGTTRAGLERAAKAMAVPGVEAGDDRASDSPSADERAEDERRAAELRALRAAGLPSDPEGR
jgi:integrase